MKFDDLQSGDRLFLDANIFVYHFLGISTECRQLLSRCHQGDLTGVTATFVVAEVMHRLMTAEAVARGLITSSQVVKKLREHPDIVQQLRTMGTVPKPGTPADLAALIVAHRERMEPIIRAANVRIE